MTLMFCTECGKKLKPYHRFCGNCGYEVGETTSGIAVTAVDVYETGIAKTKGGMWLFLLLVWVVIWGVLQLLSGLVWRAMSYATDLTLLEPSGEFVVPLITALGALFLTWRVWRKQM